MTAGATAEPLMVRRYERRTDAPDDYTYDILYVDRLTGREVMRYDGADPANTNPAYGAISDRDAMASRGRDLDEEVELSKCVVKVDPIEAQRLKEAKARKAQREQEEAEARELLGFLGDAAKEFSFDEYEEGERQILTPALEARGFADVGFYMIERDSFGPLIRGCTARDPVGKRVRFFYG